LAEQRGTEKFGSGRRAPAKLALAEIAASLSL